VVAVPSVLAPLAPLLASAILLPFLSRVDDFSRRLRAGCLASALACAVSLALMLAPGGLLWLAVDGQPAKEGAWFYVDGLSAFFATLAFTVLLAVDLYSYRVLRAEDLPSAYFSLLHLMACGLYLIFVAGDLVTLFVAWELMSVSTYALICIRRSNDLALEAGVKYLVMSAVASSLILYSISLLYGYTGAFSYTAVREAVARMGDPRAVWVAVALMTAGFGFKSGLVPFHTWVPDVYQESLDPVTAMLSGAASKAGIYVLIRVYYTLVPDPRLRVTLALLSAMTMTLGNVAALLQSDIKRLLSYSSIAHMGYTLMGIASGTALGIVAALFHALSHALAKPLVFICAGCYAQAAGSRRLESLRGVGRGAGPLTLSMVLGLLSLASIPGLSGFMSKYMLIASAFQAGLTWLALLGIANSAVGVAYYVRVMQCLLSGRGSAGVGSAVKLPSDLMLLPLALASLCALFGLVPEPLVRYLALAAAQLSG